MSDIEDIKIKLSDKEWNILFDSIEGSARRDVARWMSTTLEGYGGKKVGVLVPLDSLNILGKGGKPWGNKPLEDVLGWNGCPWME